ncbi:hypothetical protein BRADI_4g01850v3 [Brachypodium distachyon]|uniref:Uncharacterized protein n=1 Tax=Brachypodium distachyon TaxID=15368 RepID=A0A2K2CJZ2_BRADI|nr:hypothetical protein BRADI_4g01850v3 [Brachypodium distachyon]
MASAMEKEMRAGARLMEMPAVMVTATRDPIKAYICTDLLPPILPRSSLKNSGIELTGHTMSDIKYIIVSDVEGEKGEQPGCCSRSRPFPCLAVVRYVAAGVVAVLAVTVISMVIRAMLRSEDIRLFVNNGYIGADSLWVSEITHDAVVKVTPIGAGAGAGRGHPKTTTSATEAAQIGVSKSDLPEETPEVTQVNPYTTGANLGTGDYGGDAAGAGAISKSGGSCYLGCSGGSGSGTTFNNPPPAPPASKIDCNDTVVTISDAAANTNQKIVTLQLSNFTVPEQTTITLQKRPKITDQAVLNYIWDRYGGRSTFGVAVRVSSTVVSYPLGKMTEPKRQTYNCRSVTLGLVQDEASFANQVDCTAAENDKEPKTAPPAAAPTSLAPAPAPAH